MIKVKESVKKLEDYFVPQDFTRVKLNQNESPFDVPDELKRKIFMKLTEVNWNRYPMGYPESLISKISDYIDFPVSGIMVGNSSNEMIQTAIYSFCSAGDKILMIKPGFSVYKRIASIMNIGVVEVPLKENFAFDVEGMKENSNDVKMIIFPTPNNPTGTVLDNNGIEELTRDFDGIVVVDEAYFEFYGKSAQELLNRYKNVIILRTFSKAMSLAGIRLGYMYGDSEIIKEMNKAKLPFSVGLFQQIVGETVLGNMKFIDETVKSIVNERERIMNEFGRIDRVDHIPSHTNFILFQVGNIPSEKLFHELYEKGVVLRFFGTPLLKNWLRVTVGSRRENDFFREKLDEVIKGDRI